MVETFIFCHPTNSFITFHWFWLWLLIVHLYILSFVYLRILFFFLIFINRCIPSVFRVNNSFLTFSSIQLWTIITRYFHHLISHLSLRGYLLLNLRVLFLLHWLCYWELLFVWKYMNLFRTWIFITIVAVYLFLRFNSIFQLRCSFHKLVKDLATNLLHIFIWLLMILIIGGRLSTLFHRWILEIQG